MALFSPYDVERLYGKAFGDIAVSEDVRIAGFKLNFRQPLEQIAGADPAFTNAVVGHQLRIHLADGDIAKGFAVQSLNVIGEDTVNRANPIAGRINMSNLCSEILQVNSASTFDENLDYATVPMAPSGYRSYRRPPSGREPLLRRCGRSPENP
jgi:ribonucleoside-diphosphate reductase alpha chain